MLGSDGPQASGAPFSIIVKLLPFLESGHVSDKIDWNNNAFAATVSLPERPNGNAGLAQEKLMAVLCPSYSGALTSGNTTDYTVVAPALTNYKGIGATTQAIMNDSSLVKASTVSGAFDDGGGMINPYAPTRAPKATSLTMLMVETREPNQAAWYDGSTASIYGLDDQGANAKPTINNQHLTGGATQYDTAWGTNGMTYGPSSEHPGVIVVSMADGSARTVGNDVSGQVWKALITKDSADNSAISEYFTTGG